MKKSKQQEPEEPSFEEALARLEELVARLENEATGLDEALACYEEAAGLTRFCRRKLHQAESKLRLLRDDGRLEEWEPEELEAEPKDP